MLVSCCNSLQQSSQASPVGAWPQALGTHTWQALALAQPRHGGQAEPPLCPQPGTQRIK